MRCARDGFAVLAPNFFFRHPDQATLNAGNSRYDITDPESVRLISRARDGEEPQGCRPGQGRRHGLLPDRAAPAGVRGRGPDQRRGGVVRRRATREWEERTASRSRSTTSIAKLDCPVFGAFGEADHIISLADVRRLRDCLERRTGRATTSTSTRARRMAGSTTPCRAATARRRRKPDGRRNSAFLDVFGGGLRFFAPLAFRLRQRPRLRLLQECPHGVELAAGPDYD